MSGTSKSGADAARLRQISRLWQLAKRGETAFKFAQIARLSFVIEGRGLPGTTAHLGRCEIVSTG